MVLLQRLELLHHRKLVHLHVHVRQRAAKFANQGRQEFVGHQADEADANLTALAHGRTLGNHGQFLHRRQHHACVTQYGDAGRGELHRAFVAVEQARLEPVFQLPDLATQCRLRHVQLLSSAAKTEFLRDRDEVAQWSNVHRRVRKSRCCCRTQEARP